MVELGEGTDPGLEWLATAIAFDVSFAATEMASLYWVKLTVGCLPLAAWQYPTTPGWSRDARAGQASLAERPAPPLLQRDEAGDSSR